MKILVVHNHYQQFGGEHTAVEAQTALLRGHGHEIVLYTRDNATIQGYGARDKALFFPRTVFSRETYDQVTRLVQQERPAVAHVHNVFPLISPAVYRALATAGVPIVQTVHNFRFLCVNSLFYTHDRICELCKSGKMSHAVRLRCYRNSYSLSALYALSIGLHRRWGTFQMIDRFIALSGFSAQKLVEGGVATRDRITVLGNFLPDPLPAPRSLAACPPYVLYLGRLSREKGVATLIEAMAGVPELGLKILGDGPEASELRRLVAQRGLTNVEFMGHVTGEEKWELLRGALVTVVPSLWYEHFPFALLESMAVGTPVVASRLGSLADLIDEGRSGLLFRHGDSAGLAAVLRALAGQPDRALGMGNLARQTVEDRWTSRVHYQGLMHLYGELTQRRGYRELKA
jgi:glycosyltransferase involved in cell wall biosynthesis